MACCTTIPHLNNKRKSGGIFDLPRASKQRRPLASTMTTAATSSFLANRPSTMFTTSASAQDKHVFVEAESSVRSSVFQMKTSYSPLADVSSSLVSRRLCFFTQKIKTISNHYLNLVQACIKIVLTKN